MNRTLHTEVIQLVAIILLIFVGQSNLVGQNLIKNGSGEEPLVGGEIPEWTEAIGTTWTYRSSNPSPQDGSNYIFAGTTANATLEQSVDVSGYSGAIDNSIQEFNFKGYVNSFSGSDESRIMVSYRNASGVELESYDTGFSAPTTWTLRQDQRFAPVGTREIVIQLISNRTAGNNNDAYYDNLSLEALNPNPNQIGSDIDGEAIFDQSGRSVSMSSDGKRVAIGAAGNDGNGSFAGHVRIYEEIGGIWNQVGSDIEGETAFDQSGGSVSISADGKRVAIGSITNDGNGNDAGHVRIFEEIGGVWNQVGGNIEGEAANDLLGFALSISGDGMRIAIGAFNNDGNGTNSGQVRVFEDVNGVWVQLGGDIFGEAAEDRLGSAVSLSPNGLFLAIGTRSGEYVKIYEELNGIWSQVGANIINGSGSSFFGEPVAISADGKRVIIGDIGNGEAGINAGQVQVYHEVGGLWSQLGSNINGEAFEDVLGRSVSISSDGKRIAIGASNSGGTGIRAGHVRIYDEVGGDWSQVGSNINGEVAFDQSGWSVSLSFDGTRVAIGAIDNDGNESNSGHVRVYSLPQLLPVELIFFTSRLHENTVKLDWSTASETDNAGFEIQKSADGKTWEILGFVEGKGNSAERNVYAYQDDSPYDGVNYYRLKQVDYNGAYEYSDTEIVQYLSESHYTLYPNPTSGKVTIDSPKEDVLIIYNSLGLKISEMKVKKGDNLVDLSGYRNGVYMFLFADGSSRVVVKY